jgi:hypothetical protein
LQEEHVLQLNFELKRTKQQKWSTLFDNMEQMSKELPINDYSLSQTTLEQVFLEFSRQVAMPDLVIKPTRTETLPLNSTAETLSPNGITEHLPQNGGFDGSRL